MGRLLWITIFLTASSWAQANQTLALDDVKPLPMPPHKAVEKSEGETKLQEELAARFVEFRKRNALPALKRLKTDDLHRYCAGPGAAHYPALQDLGDIYVFEAQDALRATKDLEQVASQHPEKPSFGDPKRFAIEVCELNNTPRIYRVVVGYRLSALDAILDNLSLPIPRLL